MLTCSSKLAVFLRERDCQTLEDVAAKADLLLEAQMPSSSNRQGPDEVTNRQGAGNGDTKARGET